MKKISALLALGALSFALQITEPADAALLRIEKIEAVHLTQAVAVSTCVLYLHAKKMGTTHHCLLQDNSWVSDHCDVHNPKPPYSVILGPFALCKLRWWEVENKTGRKLLHGCLYVIRRRPPFYKLKGACRYGTEFPTFST